MAGILSSSEKLLQPIHMILSKNLKTLSQYFPEFLESTSNFKHFAKNMTLAVYAFSKLQIVKGMVTQISK